MSIFSRDRKAPRPFSLGHIFLTGSSRGIGKALALELAGDAEQVTLVARNAAQLNEIASTLRSKAVGLPLDLLELVHNPATLTFFLANMPPIDTLILNAGTSSSMPLSEWNEQEANHEWALNYLSQVALLRVLRSHLRRAPTTRIVVVSSLSIFLPFPGHGNYVATKAALTAWAKSVSFEEELADMSWHFVYPGLTDTDLSSELETDLPRMSAESVAKATRKGLIRGEREIIPGLTNRATALLGRHLPGTVNTLFRLGIGALVPTAARKGKS